MQRDNHHALESLASDQHSSTWINQQGICFPFPLSFVKKAGEKEFSLGSVQAYEKLSTSIGMNKMSPSQVLLIKYVLTEQLSQE